ncbi:acetyl/propionyl/methylcrotonyl-CoA carboxylase subunit alpha [Leifsonia kafniensis]|uniref:biotin carboxylase n=2 Tax=Leifsonia kafniensis TaxID=475957 RepID=A0ABP7L4X8_9MICO
MIPQISDTAMFTTDVFATVLVANRGEIACRVITTLRRLGIRSVAVFSDADRNARHVALADVAVRIGPAEARESYLNIEAILRAAAETGAQAIHPGYGFLSENEEFARATAEAGLTFIGPSVHALRVMGDKIRAKNHVAESGVPTTPGIALPGLDNAALAAAAADVGYPLLIKPSAGGGGKGMYVVEAASELAAALDAARRVAARAFGDDTLFLERLIPSPRHIEVQVLADNYGNIIHLGERECSLQRRHQKVIEEAPSPLLDEPSRRRIGAAACAAARSVDYRGAGTVEFLVSDAEPDAFYFMEMNTRLQVEHPVTELVTGLDLVEWQVRIAAGERLALAQDDVRLTGHSIEARVYAESPAAGFLPATGSVLALDEAHGDGIRVDSSLTPGLVLGADYDPLLAKVIAWGVDRGQALARLDRALSETVVLGVPTNIEYLRLLLHTPAVRAGHLDTELIERTLPSLIFRAIDDRLLAAAALFLRAHAEALPLVGGEASATSPWTSRSGWRIGEHQPTPYTLQVGTASPVTIHVDDTTDASRVTVGDCNLVSASLQRIPGRPHGYSVEFDGSVSTVDIVAAGNDVWLGTDGATFRLRVLSRQDQLAARLAAAEPSAGVADPAVRSPMPGTVISVNVADGSSVEAGDTLLVVEAMKMEHRLAAALGGIATVAVAVGDLVSLGQIVATIQRPDPASSPEGSPSPALSEGSA